MPTFEGNIFHTHTVPSIIYYVIIMCRFIHWKQYVKLRYETSIPELKISFRLETCLSVSGLTRKDMKYDWNTVLTAEQQHIQARKELLRADI